MENSIIPCKNCEEQLSKEDLYCGNCGQKVIIERYTVRRFWSELIRIVTNVERGFWFTLKRMFVAPATVISNYLNGKTKPYYHPFRYIFIWASISVLIGLYLHFYDDSQETFNDMLGINQTDEQKARQAVINKYIKSYMNLIYLIIIPFMSWFTWRFFKKKGYNYAEHLIANCFAMGQMAFFGIFLILVYSIFPQLMPFTMFLGILISAFYYAYVYKGLFQVSYGNAFVKSLLSLVLAYITMMLVMIIVGIIVGLIIGLIMKFAL